MKSSAHAMSELIAGSMTTTGRTMDVTARLTYVPRDPHVITVTITDRAGAVPIWTIGRDLLLSPKQKGESLNYFIYPYAEVDGKPFASLDKSFTYSDAAAVNR